MPSLFLALGHSRSLRQAVAVELSATRAIGVLVPPGRPGVLRGALAHGGISLAMTVLLAAALPGRRPVAEGAAAGLVMGVVNVAIIGRRFPAIRRLPLLPQLADNVAFGVVVSRRLG